MKVYIYDGASDKDESPGVYLTGLEVNVAYDFNIMVELDAGEEWWITGGSSGNLTIQLKQNGTSLWGTQTHLIGQCSTVINLRITATQEGYLSNDLTLEATQDASGETIYWGEFMYGEAYWGGDRIGFKLHDKTQLFLVTVLALSSSTLTDLAALGFEVV